MKALKFLSILLLYPDKELINHLGELKEFAIANKLDIVMPLLEYLENADMLEVQAHYTANFDLTPSCSLYLLEHDEDNKNKGSKLLIFLEKYSKENLKLTQNHTPDYLPIYLEYLSLIPKDMAIKEIERYSDVLKKIFDKLLYVNSPYASVFEALLNKEVLYGLD